MNQGDIIRNNSGYEFCVKRYTVVDNLPIAVLEAHDSQQPFVMCVGLRLLPNGRCVFDRGTWFASFSSALYQFDVEKTKKKMERYAI